MRDLTEPLEKDAKVEILTPKNPESLIIYRHSTAHLLAAAVLELYPETKLGIGPAIENGFYYDFDRPTAFTPEDLEKIERKMWEIQKRRVPYERVYTRKEEGLKKYSEAWMKCELIEERAGEIFTEYTLGPQFIDFCRGPHLPDTHTRSRRSSCSPSPAHTGVATRRTSSFSASTERRFSVRRSSTKYLARLEEAPAPIIASWARNSNSSR